VLRGGGAVEPAFAADRTRGVQALLLRRRDRRRDRRSGEERARHRLRRGRGSRIGPERPRRADRARLCRNAALRRSVGRRT
jgi:hypothetical protein